MQYTPKNTSLQRGSAAKKLVIIGSIVVVVGGLGFIFRDAISGFVNGIFAPTPTEEVAKTVEELQIEANVAEFNGDNDAALAAYDTAIASTTDPTEQARLYMRKAEAQASIDSVEAAIASAKKAEELAGENLGTVTILASLYAQSNKNAEAAVYYRKAAELTTNEGSSAGDKEYYLETAERLEKM